MIESNRVTAYRPDIDGLRGIAVLGVVLYHLGIGPLHGGFVGVDIFFVISGYLITGIIHREIQQGCFTFAKFYERRVRRIFPALFAVLLVTVLVGLWLLLPTDLLMLGKSTMATLFFGSNVLFWRSSGYFDPSSEFNPLLHMWSLAVEEQFYIVLPILLLLVHRIAGGRSRSILLIGAAISLAACLAVQPIRPTAVFFLSPFRAWELLAGGLLAIGVVPDIPTRWPRELLSALALLLLGVSLVITKPGESFPGWQAILPVFATAILLHTGAYGTSTVQRALQLKPLAFVGMISYSLYLWHWPFLVFARYINTFEPLEGWKWILLLLSMMFATASYYWIEQPFRAKGKAPPARSLFQQAGLSMGGLALVALVLVALRGIPARFSDRVVALDKAGKPDIPFRSCFYHSVEQYRHGDLCLAGDPGARPNLLIWGDSHSLAWAPAFDAVLKAEGRSALLAMTSTCPPLLGVLNQLIPGCNDINDAVLEYLRRREDISMIVMIAYWPAYSSRSKYVLQDDEGREGNLQVFPPALERTVRTLRHLGKRVWIIGPTPGAPKNISFRLAMAERAHRQEPEAISLSESSRRAAGFDAALPAALSVGGVFYTDPRPWFCNRSGRCDYMRSGELLYRDDNHLTVHGAQLLTPYLEKEISRFVNEPWWASKVGPVSLSGAD